MDRGGASIVAGVRSRSARSQSSVVVVGSVRIAPASVRPAGGACVRRSSDGRRLDDDPTYSYARTAYEGV